MVLPGLGLDTPRTNLGDATYLSHQPDFDISQELSFQSPSKDKNNLIEQLRAGRRGVGIRTPRSRAPLIDRRNIPAFAGGGEFTPLLKNATRNSAIKFGVDSGAVPATPAFLKQGRGLDQINENSPLPDGDFRSSIYSERSDYINGTLAPVMDESTTGLDTPVVIQPRRGGKDNVLQDGNQLSLREQENVIDRIEKENFALKLKIHFLEKAVSKAGPGFNEAALKENTELKVDKVTMQKELMKSRRNLNNAEKDIEDYRKQMVEMQERSKSKNKNEDQQQEIRMLQSIMEEREQEVEELTKKLNDAENELANVDKLRDEVVDLEADLREKDRAAEEKEDQLEDIKSQLEEKIATITDLQKDIKHAKRREVELEEQLQSSEDFDVAKGTIEDLERDVKRLKAEIEETDEARREAMSEKETVMIDKQQAEAKAERAVNDLEELRDELANKSMTSRGFSRQMEEKANKLSDDLEDLQEAHVELQLQYEGKARDVETLMKRVHDLQQNGNLAESKLRDDLEAAEEDRNKLEAHWRGTEDELERISAGHSLLQARHDALTAESVGLQNDLKKSQERIEDLEDKLDHEKTLALQSEREIRDQYKTEIDRLNNEIEDLRADLREKEREYDSSEDKWEVERRKLETELDQAGERSTGLQRTLDKLQEIETTIHGKEFKMQAALDTEKQRHADEEALLKRQIGELNQDLETRRLSLEVSRSELSDVKESLRLSQREQKTLADQVESLEDEIEVLQTNLDDESEQARNDISAAKKETQAIREELYVVKLDLQKAEAAVNQPQESTPFKDRLNTRLHDIEAKLLKARQEKQELHNQWTEVTIELATVKAYAADIESERDEYKQQLEEVQHSHGEAVDQEKVELRTKKLRLESEVHHAHEEAKLLTEQLTAIESELNQEVERAIAEEGKLNNIIAALQKQIVSTLSSSDRESKRTFQSLRNQITELEQQLASHTPLSSPRNLDLSILRSDLDNLRKKESDHLQREKTQKEYINTLKRQITDLERKSHELEMSHLQGHSSPASSTSNSARKSELTEVKTQLAAAQQSLKDIRAQHRQIERENSRKIASLNLEIQAQAAAFDLEKDRMEADLDQALVEKENSQSQAAQLESTITRLRAKIVHLEKDLQSSRRTRDHDTTMANERSELHEMLRETQIRADQLEMELTNSKNQISSVTSKEKELRTQLKRVREERSAQRDLAQEAVKEMTALEQEYEEEKKRWSEEQSIHKEKAIDALRGLRLLEREYFTAVKTWEEERARLDQGIKMAQQARNAALSNPTPPIKNDEKALVVRNPTAFPTIGNEEIAEAEERHMRELRGLLMQIQWLQALVKREETLRSDAAFAKKYLELRIEGYEACNKADLDLLRRSGHAPPTSKSTAHHPPSVAQGNLKPSFRLVAIAVRASIRLQRGAWAWSEALAIRDRVQESLESLRKRRVLAAHQMAQQGQGNDYSGIMVNIEAKASDMTALSPFMRAKKEEAERAKKLMGRLTKLTAESARSPSRRNDSQSARHPALAGVDMTGSLEGLRSKMVDGGYGSPVNPRIKSLNGSAKKEKRKLREERLLARLAEGRAPEIGRGLWPENLVRGSVEV